MRRPRGVIRCSGATEAPGTEEHDEEEFEEESEEEAVSNHEEWGEPAPIAAPSQKKPVPSHRAQVEWQGPILAHRNQPRHQQREVKKKKKKRNIEKQGPQEEGSGS